MEYSQGRVYIIASMLGGGVDNQFQGRRGTSSFIKPYKSCGCCCRPFSHMWLLLPHLLSHRIDIPPAMLDKSKGFDANVMMADFLVNHMKLVHYQLLRYEHYNYFPALPITFQRSP